jgi:hypothetical protein
LCFEYYMMLFSGYNYNLKICDGIVFLIWVIEI